MLISLEISSVASSDLRKEFLETIGKTYDTYGYPEYCGWIEGLLMLEPKEWTQQGISDRLKELFSDSKYPTSVPSVNRALKILESYGMILKTGSRKSGYRYRLVSASNIVSSMFHQLLVVNQEFIKKMEVLRSKNRKVDSDLSRAISSQISNAKAWNRVMEQIIESMQDE
jgi:DNA-binding transcriptional regulator GbsR (MarR family)